MTRKDLDADELLAFTAIAARILAEDGIAEHLIDSALDDAYVKGASANEWETRTRALLGLNPNWRYPKEDC